MQLLSAVLADAQRQGLIRRNPVSGQVPEQQSRRFRAEKRFITWAEAGRLEAAMDPHWSLVAPFLMESGLRIGELAALRLRDVNLAKGWVRVRASAVEIHGSVTGYSPGLIYEGTKTAAGQRVIYTLSRPLCERLKDMAQDRGLGPDDFLFSGPQGGPLRPSTFRARVWRPAVKAAGLADPQPTPHALRHSAISYWLMSGAVTMFEASKLAGHSSIKVTADVYGHIVDPRAREVRNALWEHRRDLT